LNYKPGQVKSSASPAKQCQGDTQSIFSYEAHSNSVNILVKEYVQKKLTYDRLMSEKHSRNSKSAEESSEQTLEGMKKPNLNNFLELFRDKMDEINGCYRLNKHQFEKDMKTFKEDDIRMEEEIIERSINEGGKALEQSFNQINEHLKQNCDIIKRLSLMKNVSHDTARQNQYEDNVLDDNFQEQIRTFIPQGNQLLQYGSEPFSNMPGLFQGATLK
jgi:hypothetical protein